MSTTVLMSQPIRPAWLGLISWLGLTLACQSVLGANPARRAPVEWQRVAGFTKKDFLLTTSPLRVATPGWGTEQGWRVRLISPTRDCYVMIITSTGQRVSLTAGPDAPAHRYPASAVFQTPALAVAVTATDHLMQLPADMKLIVEQIAPPGFGVVPRGAGSSGRRAMGPGSAAGSSPSRRTGRESPG